MSDDLMESLHSAVKKQKEKLAELRMFEGNEEECAFLQEEIEQFENEISRIEKLINKTPEDLSDEFKMIEKGSSDFIGTLSKDSAYEVVKKLEEMGFTGNIEKDTDLDSDIFGYGRLGLPSENIFCVTNIEKKDDDYE